MRRTFLLRYQLTPQPRSRAARADFAGSAKFGNALLSTVSAPARATSSKAPHACASGSNGRAGVTPLYEALSPVSRHETVTPQVSLVSVSENAPRSTSCVERTYSAIAPNRPAYQYACGATRLRRPSPTVVPAAVGAVACVPSFSQVKKS